MKLKGLSDNGLKRLAQYLEFNSDGTTLREREHADYLDYMYRVLEEIDDAIIPIIAQKLLEAVSAYESDDISGLVKELKEKIRETFPGFNNKEDLEYIFGDIWKDERLY